MRRVWLVCQCSLSVLPLLKLDEARLRPGSRYDRSWREKRGRQRAAPCRLLKLARSCQSLLCVGVCTYI